MDWIKLKDKQPTIDDQGVKVLLYRIMNNDQKLLSTTIHETAMVKHCNPDETWWMPLPEPPSDGNNVDARTEPALHKHIVSIAKRKVCRCYEVPPKKYDDRCDSCGKLYQDIRQT